MKMTNDEYMRLSGLWLLETCQVRDLAEATAKCFDHKYQIPQNDNLEDAPFLSTWRDPKLLQAALPLVLRVSAENAKALEIASVPTPEELAQGKKRIPFLNEKGPRIDSIVARNGIIVQFELWKSFVQPLKYPINEKQSKTYSFKDAAEKPTLIKLVRRRNELTHEPKLANDPTCQELIEYARDCRFLATQA